MRGRDAGRRGVVLVAALVFVALLAGVVTYQVEKLPLAAAESRNAPTAAQRQLHVTSALQAAVGLLRCDADEDTHDSFDDVWAAPQDIRLGETELELAIGDWAFTRPCRDPWLRHDQGFPDGAPWLATADAEVHRLFDGLALNVNTAPLRALAARAGFGGHEAALVVERRRQGGFRSAEQFMKSVGRGSDDRRAATPQLTVTSSLFLAQATIRRPGEKPERRQWVLARDGRDVHVLYAAPVEAQR